MRTGLLALALGTTLVAGVASANAMPVVQAVDTAANAPQVILTSGGCGPFAHRNPWGYCRPNGYGGGYGYGYGRPWGWHGGWHHGWRRW